MRRSRHGRHHVVTALVEEDGDARITLTGHLGGDAVDGLADELAAVLRNADRVTVDLDGLSTPTRPPSGCSPPRSTGPVVGLAVRMRGVSPAVGEAVPTRPRSSGPPPGPYPSHA
jgi:hypothetical protein